MTIKKLPTKLDYFIGDKTLDLTDIEVIGSYKNDIEKIEFITTENISGFDTSSAGTKTITITFKTKTVTFNIHVNEVTLNSLTIKKLPSKLDYFIGDKTLDLTNIEVIGSYNNGIEKIENITTENISGFDTNSTGTKTIVIKINKITADFEIKVSSNGSNITYYKNGIIQNAIDYINKYNYSEYSYYENGKRKSYNLYENSVLKEEVSYLENGSLNYSKYYKHGVLNLEFFYNEDLTSESKEYYYPEEVLKRIVYFDKNENIKNILEYSREGVLEKTIEFYSNSIIQKYTIYNIEGKIEESQVFDNIDFSKLDNEKKVTTFLQNGYDTYNESYSLNCLVKSEDYSKDKGFSSTFYSEVIQRENFIFELISGRENEILTGYTRKEIKGIYEVIKKENMIRRIYEKIKFTNDSLVTGSINKLLGKKIEVITYNEVNNHDLDILKENNKKFRNLYGNSYIKGLEMGLSLIQVMEVTNIPANSDRTIYKSLVTKYFDEITGKNVVYSEYEEEIKKDLVYTFYYMFDGEGKKGYNINNKNDYIKAFDIISKEVENENYTVIKSIYKKYDFIEENIDLFKYPDEF